MNETSATEHRCEFCNKTFKRESTLLAHTCEKRRRWLQRDTVAVRLAFQSWTKFYDTIQPGKQRTYRDFMENSYYSAFVKFGEYCCSINAISPLRFLDWLLKNNRKLDAWCSDRNYTDYLVEYLKTEDAMDALARSVEYSMTRAQEDGVQSHDVLRYGNTNRTCQAIVAGRISPWALYHSDSGRKFLDSLSADQVNTILPYIDPERWALRFRRDPDTVVAVTEILREAGW